MIAPTIQTDRLVLRAPEPEDFETYRRFFADAEASRFYNGPLPADRAWRVLATDIGHWVIRGYGRWSIITKDAGEMIGSCGLWWPEGYPRSELTWWIMPEARRRNYALEASRAAISFGYQELGWDLIETHMDDDNIAARKLVEKLGGEILTRERFPDGVERNVYALPNRTG